MEPLEKIKVILIAGLSGAGKTHASDWFEDLGYYCIDNMPPQLIEDVLKLIVGRSDIHSVAFVLDSRSGEYFGSVLQTIDALEADDRIAFSILFIEAATDTLLHRYNETRRTHPLSRGPVTAEVIEEERVLLQGVRERANYILDTTHLRTSEFNAQMSDMFLGDKPQNMRFAVNVSSFGYKYGIPQEADIVLDMRFLPNPFYVASLKHLTGKNRKVRSYVLKSPAAQSFLKRLDDMITVLVPDYVEQGKYHLNIAFGCTGGQHRSVVIANEAAEMFRGHGYRVTIEHRELAREGR